MRARRPHPFERGDDVTQQIQIARDDLDRALEQGTAAKRRLLSTLPPADDGEDSEDETGEET